MLRQPRRLLFAIMMLLLWLTSTALSQQPGTNPVVTHVLGLENVKRGARGKLSVEPGSLNFVSGKAEANVPISSIQDVLTGEDSERAIGGTLGKISMFAPYGGGRFLSLFRKKTDVLTIQYRDPNGGLHGVIFSLPQGQARVIKKELVGRGARTSIPIEEPQQQSNKKN